MENSGIICYIYNVHGHGWVGTRKWYAIDNAGTHRSKCCLCQLHVHVRSRKDRRLIDKESVVCRAVSIIDMTDGYNNPTYSNCGPS